MTGPAKKVFESDKTTLTNGEPLPHPQSPEEEQARANALEGIHHGMTLPNAPASPGATEGVTGCLRCEVVPAPLAGPGTLHLRYPHPYALGRALEFLAGSRWKHHEKNGILQISVGPGESLAPLIAPLIERMSGPEQRDTQVRFQHPSHDATLPLVTGFSDIADLPTFAAYVGSTWLLDILREKRLYSVFQPIVTCQEDSAFPSGTNRIFGYECLMRATVDGRPASPADMLDIARAAGLLFQLDLAARRAALAGAAEHNIRQLLFINFTPNAIYNPATCLASTVRLVDELQIERERVVFEIIETERLLDIALTKRIVGFYRDQGFKVALDDVGSGFSSLSLLLDLKPDFVKIDRSLIRHVDVEPERALVARKLLEVAQELGIASVAEGIETPGELDWVRAHGADLAQGYLLARPSTPPPLLTVS